MMSGKEYATPFPILQAVSLLNHRTRIKKFKQAISKTVKSNDHVIDLGPGAGALGGEIVAQGKPDEIIRADTVTGRWLQDDTKEFIPKRSCLRNWVWPNQRRKH